jgi:bifunctional non-homologous end joining protein LigD
MARRGRGAERASVDAVLAQLDTADDELTLEVDTHRVPVSHLSKPLWPRAGRTPATTKRDLLAYFARISSYMLPHLAGRPVFVTRFPHGIGGKSFYQKVWDAPPRFVRTVGIWSSDNDEARDYLLCENLATLLWLAQQAALELHVWFSRISAGADVGRTGVRYGESEQALDRSRLNYPDFIVVDLDPYAYSGKEAKGAEPELHRRAFNHVREVAFEMREIAGSLGLETFVKTSGRTGLHLYLPILRRFTFDEVRAMAETMGRHLAARRPGEVTLEWAVKKRTGKIFFDFNQNVRGKSLAAILSPRRHAGGTVSMPLAWNELADAYPTDFTMRTAPDLLDERGDPWARILRSKGDLAAVLDSSPASRTRAG